MHTPNFDRFKLRRSMLAFAIAPMAMVAISGSSTAQTAMPASETASGNVADSFEAPAGRFVAVHFVGAATSDAASGFVRRLFADAPLSAGVRHVIVFGGDGAGAKAFATGVGASANAVIADADGAIAARFKVLPSSAGSPEVVTLVIDSEGKEVLRSASAGGISTDEFVKKLDSATRAPTEQYNLPSGKNVAVEGYDVVAYFKPGKPTKGKAEFASHYRGVVYQFASVENRAAFAAAPENYLPTYGGWCATAMGQSGEKVEIDPTNFKITHGRLFLFYKGFLGNAVNDWNKHEREWEPAADSNWKKFSGEVPLLPSSK